MSSLSFVPRKLTKSTNSNNAGLPKTQGNAAKKYTNILASSSTVASSTSLVAEDQKLEKYDDQNFANLIALALSDYALWLDTDLRQKAGIGIQPTSNPDSGYISLNYLIEHSAALAGISDAKSGKERQTSRSKIQAAIVKGIRAHASQLLDVRLQLHPDETVPHFGKQKDVAGGYEVRRKHVSLIMRGKHDWDACTLYLENIPPGSRTFSEIIILLLHLLHDTQPVPSSSMVPTDPLTRIQGITFPLHHSDKPGTHPSCKGFSLVTFAYSSDCEHLKNRWPWDVQESQNTIDTKDTGESDTDSLSAGAIRLARQHKFRVMTKERWLQLKSEYLAYRDQLVENMNAYQDSRPTLPRPLQGREQSALDNPIQANTQHSVSANHIPTHFPDSTASFPPDCLVFVKNVHPETTKTTLRAFFSQALPPQSSQSSQNKCEGLDYVDFNKGMDTCYLRLATSKHALGLVGYFDHQVRQVVQKSGLDDVGTDLISNSGAVPKSKPVIVSHVKGRPEEIYWEKVPLKIRKASVEKAIQLMKDGCDGVDVGLSAGRKRTVGDVEERPTKKRTKV